MVLHIGILAFPQVQQLDLTGPYEVFASLKSTEVHLVWKDLSPLPSETGLTLIPTMTLEHCPALDVVCVPGGAGIDALLDDKPVLDFLRRQAAGARYVTSVCTGALLLGAAGLLDGKRATTHWFFHDLLARFGAVPIKGRVVRDGNLITAGGITAGIDFSLRVAAELLSRAEAEAVQLGFEYAPEPPFEAGEPQRAPPAVLAAVTERMAPGRQRREAVIDRVLAAQGHRVETTGGG